MNKRICKSYKIIMRCWKYFVTLHSIQIFENTTGIKMSAVSRVIPVTVVLYRVLMVCHVEFCYNHGEKVIRDKLFRWGTHVPGLSSRVTCPACA